MNRSRLVKNIIGYGVLAALFWSLGFLYTYFTPRAESFLLKQIVSQASNQSPFEVSAKKLTLLPWMLGLEITELELKPKESIKSQVSAITVLKSHTRLSLLGLIRGQIRLAHLSLDSVRAHVFINTQNTSQSEINIPLDQIYRAPIDSVEVTNITLLGRIDPQNTVFKLEDLSLRAENRFRSLWIDIEAPNTLLKPAGPTPAIDLQLEARGLIESDQIRLTALKIKRQKSFLVSSGFFWGDISKAKITSNEMATKVFVDLESLKDWTAAFAPSFKMPDVSGVVNLTSGSGIKSSEPYMNFKIEGDHLRYGQFNIGRVDLNGTYSKNSINQLGGQIINPSGILDLDNFSASFVKDQPFSIQLNSRIELGAFLNAIGIKKVPLSIHLNGKTSCSGRLKETFYMSCDKAQIEARDAHVYNENKNIKNTIVKFKAATATGAFEVTDKEVKFASEISLGAQSKGSAKGSVDYQNGFAIFFQGDQFNFSDIENLANLKLEGVGSLSGETRGNSKTAKTFIDAKLKEVSLDDFKLGQLSSEIRYERGYLHFKETSGLYGNTRYSGHMSLNLIDSQLYLYIKSPYLELNDVKQIIEKRLHIPIITMGTGNAEFKASGPIDIERLDYEIKASIFRGNLANEPFDSIHTTLRAQEGVLKTESFKLTKGPGEVVVNGELRPSWSVDLTATGKNLRLEQSELLSTLGLDIQGRYAFTTKVFGDLKKPVVEINAETENMIAGSLPVDNSKVSLKIFENHLEGSAQVMGDKIVSDFNLPFSDKHPFALKAKVTDLNIASIFEAVSQARRTYNFTTSLSMTADLSSAQGGFWKSTGLINVSQFLIQRGGQKLSNEGDMKLVFENGVINTEKFNLIGDSNNLNLELNSSTKDVLIGKINGKLDLNLVGPFLTFATDVKGIVSLNTSVKGSLGDVNVSGSAYLDKGYIKAKDFPHPFTDLRADMLFNQKTLFVNSFQGVVADGKISGDGRLKFENSKSIPIRLSGNIKDLNTNFPEGYLTKGSLSFSLEGQRQPYRFKMDYQVTQAQVVSDFGGKSGPAEVKRSPYLPPSIAKSAEEPFFLDLDVNFLSPLTISNSLMKASLNGKLGIQGTAQRLIMNGTLTPVPGGIVFFRDVPFEVANGFIEFDSVAPDNPKLYIAAHSRVGEIIYDEDRRQTERQYDVSMLVQGRARDPQVTLTSQPPLPQKDIVSLLALGMTPEALDESRTTGTQVTSTSTTALGAALLQKPVGKRLKDNFGVDMKVSSSQATADVASSARVTLSKQWTPKLSVSASGTLEANPRNSVRMEYQVSRKLSVIGSWEGREQGTIQDNARKDVTNSILGLDLEYRMQFK